MEDKNFEQFIKEVRKSGLSDEERNSIRESVFNFIKNNPVSGQTQPRLKYSSGKNFWDWSSIYLRNFNLASIMALLLILTVAVSSGVGLAAEKALPGDFLYPVKLNVNENIRGLTNITDQQKADWEIQKADRRLEEAENLASKGSLDSKNQAVIEANFEAQSRKVKDRINSFEDKSDFKAAASVSASFETSLQVHEKILQKISEEKKDSKKDIEPIDAKIRSEVTSIRNRRDHLELKIRSHGNTKFREGKKSSSSDDNWSDTEVNDDINMKTASSSIRQDGHLRLKLRF